MNRRTIVWLALIALPLLVGCHGYPTYVPVLVTGVEEAGDKLLLRYDTSFSFDGIAEKRETPDGPPTPVVRVGFTITNNDAERPLEVDFSSFAFQEEDLKRRFPLSAVYYDDELIGKQPKVTIEPGKTRHYRLAFELTPKYDFGSLSSFRVRWSLADGEASHPLLARFSRYELYYDPYPRYYVYPAFHFGYHHGHHGHHGYHHGWPWQFGFGFSYHHR